jgi:hypothetical protein
LCICIERETFPLNMRAEEVAWSSGRRIRQFFWVILSFVPLTAQHFSYVLPRMAAVNCAAFCYVKFGSFTRLDGMFYMFRVPDY